MLKSHIIHLLKSLSLNELYDLKHFIEIHSSAGIDKLGRNKPVSRKLIIELYEILLKEYPAFSGSNLKKENIYKKLCPKEKFNDKKFRSLKSDFSRILEMYLAFLDLAQDSESSKIHLINQLEKRKLNDLMESNISEAKKFLDMRETRDEDYYYQNYYLSKRKRINNEKAMKLGKGQADFNILNEEIDHIIKCFSIIMYKHKNLISHFQTHMEININTDFYDYLDGYFKKNKNLVESSSVLLVLNSFLNLHKEINNKNILVAKDLLDKYEKCFSILDFQFLYIDLLNCSLSLFYIDKINNKDLFFEVFNECLIKEVFVQNGFINDHNYSNIVSLALQLKDIKLAEKIILSYKEKLLPEFKENAFAFNYAKFYYELKEYKMALEFLAKVKNIDFYYGLDIHNLQLKINYDINYIQATLNIIDSYRHFFLLNRQIPKEEKLRNKNFLKYFEKLLKIKIGSSKLEPGLLLKQIKSVPEMAVKSWLIERTSELQKELEKNKF